MFSAILAPLLSVLLSMFSATSANETTTKIETLAFCGVHPNSPSAEKAVFSLSYVAGIDATFGPCMAPGPNYTPANNDLRYVQPDVYMRLVRLNAKYGMQTVVYDARLWSDSPLEQSEAVIYWTPVIDHIAGWDMGDEFDPRSEMSVLIDRWASVESLNTGVEPFTNHLPDNPDFYGSAIQTWIDNMPDAATKRISFDSYDLVSATAHVRKYNSYTENLTCAVNVLSHGPYVVTDNSIRRNMRSLRIAGCDTFLIFGGEIPIGTNGYFGTQSLVDEFGNATSWAESVFEGSFFNSNNVRSINFK